MRKEEENKEIWVTFKYSQRSDKPNELIIRELLSNILQILLKSNWATQEQIDAILDKIYNY